MRAIPYALSVHHFITTVGADAGFAAIIGLAIVVLLFFAHARETANLRRRADEAQDALHRLEQYVDQLSRSEQAPVAAPASAVSAPAPRPQIAASPAAAAWAGTAAPVASRAVDPARPPVAAMAGVPGAPAGVGAPALSAATRLIPVTDTAIAIRANRSETVAGVSGFATGGTAAAVMDPPGPAPSTTAGGANGNRTPPAPPPALPPAPPPASAGQTARPRPGATRAPASAAQRRSGKRGDGSRIGRGAIALVVALVVVVAVAVVLVVHNSGGSHATKTAATNTARHTRTSASHKSKTKSTSKSAPAVAPASVTVAVINGTSTTNLAHDISQKLTTAGYKPGHLATATDQTQSSTIVGYLVPGDKPDALAVAKSLKLGPAAVQAVDPNNRTLACGATTSCPAQVIVTVGTDLAANA